MIDVCSILDINMLMLMHNVSLSDVMYNCDQSLYSLHTLLLFSYNHSAYHHHYFIINYKQPIFSNQMFSTNIFHSENLVPVPGDF